jgi:adenosine deaminase
MSDTRMRVGTLRSVEAFDYGRSDIKRFTIDAMDSASISFHEPPAIVDEVIKPLWVVRIG